jgi:hypothetical protein
VFAALLAFTLHLDAAILLDQLRSDPDLRARLVASADAMTKEADLVLGTSVPSVYRRAAERLQAETTELRDAGQPPELFTEAEGMAWVMKGLGTAGEARRNQVRQRYQALVREELSSLTGSLSADASRIRQQLEGAGLQLIPDYAKHTRADNWPDWWPRTEAKPPANVSAWNRHFFGILASVALLSLGAPFWFNALKTATTLRPIVATKEKEDRAQRT